MRCLTKFLLLLTAAALLLNAAERFDNLVRSDFFTGMAGDQAALDRAMKVCEDALAKDPKHAEALVWHGGGLIFNAGTAFRSNDIPKGRMLWQRGMQEMDDAVTLAPNSVGVLIPRGATLLTVASFLPDAAQSKNLTRTGVQDYRKVYDLQKDYFDKLSAHARGELLYGMAAGYSRLNDKDQATLAFNSLLALGKGSGHEPEAIEWVKTGAFTARPMQCTGCHTAK